MIISHAHHFAFFRVPRTGSTTAEVVLRMAVAFGSGDVLTRMPQRGLPARNMPAAHDVNGPPIYGNHYTPLDAINFGLMTEQQLRDYDCFCFMRDPLERYVSAFIAGAGVPIHPDAFIRIRAKLNERDMGILTNDPETYTHWNGEELVKALDFSNYESNVRRLITLLGGIQPAELPNLNPNRNRPPGVRSSEYLTAESIAALEAIPEIAAAQAHRRRIVFD